MTSGIGSVSVLTVQIEKARPLSEAGESSDSNCFSHFLFERDPCATHHAIPNCLNNSSHFATASLIVVWASAIFWSLLLPSTMSAVITV